MKQCAVCGTAGQPGRAGPLLMLPKDRDGIFEESNVNRQDSKYLLLCQLYCFCYCVLSVDPVAQSV